MSNVKAVRRVERAIIRRALLDGKAAGYTFNVDNGGGPELIAPTNHVKTILETMFATDDEHLTYHRADGKQVGWAYFVHGNGWCVLSDHSTNLERVLLGANELADCYA